MTICTQLPPRRRVSFSGVAGDGDPPTERFGAAFPSEALGPLPAEVSRRQKAVNHAHAKIRARGERAIATLKTWKILAKLRCCPHRATAIVQAILVLHHVETTRYTG